ncbi:MAG: hypothetical protein ACFE9I_02520 [Candidatus Hermodarchaeota archaeon]
MSPFTKEDVTSLAFKIYKENQPLEKAVWRLAELCVTINKNIKDGYDIKPLETDNLILLIREDVNGQLITATEEEIKDLAEIIYHENPSKSQLDWYIAEKELLLKEITSLIRNNS